MARMACTTHCTSVSTSCGSCAEANAVTANLLNYEIFNIGKGHFVGFPACNKTSAKCIERINTNQTIVILGEFSSFASPNAWEKIESLLINWYNLNRIDFSSISRADECDQLVVLLENQFRAFFVRTYCRYEYDWKTYRSRRQFKSIAKSWLYYWLIIGICVCVSRRVCLLVSSRHNVCTCSENW